MHASLILADDLPSNKEKLRSGEMHVRGDQWPIFLYADLAFDQDAPWDGLLKNQLLVAVSPTPINAPTSRGLTCNFGL